MPVKGGACPVRDTLFCNVIMLGDFLIYFFFFSAAAFSRGCILLSPLSCQNLQPSCCRVVCIRLSLDAVWSLSVAARRDVKAVCKDRKWPEHWTLQSNATANLLNSQWGYTNKSLFHLFIGLWSDERGPPYCVYCCWSVCDFAVHQLLSQGWWKQVCIIMSSWQQGAGR